MIGQQQRLLRVSGGPGIGPRMTQGFGGSGMLLDAGLSKLHACA